jgi:phosphoribosylformylglycinamidine cyclo-ligase
MSTDGVGTKLELARQSGIWDGVGFDLVAMCVDDLTAVGARPIGFVDYMAVGALDPDRDNAIVASIARACAVAGCPLLGGETAEHPGVMPADAVDLAGAVTGVVEEGEELSPSSVEVGDVIIGLASPNLRSNGFSLIRSLFADEIPYEELLEPSIIYSKTVLAAADRVKSAAHITGGGLPGNVMRAVPPGLGVRIDRSTWQPPPIFGTVAAKGVTMDEMFRTFNMGIGFCLIADPDLAPDLIYDLSESEPTAIGSVTGTGEFVLA